MLQGGGPHRAFSSGHIVMALVGLTLFGVGAYFTLFPGPAPLRVEPPQTQPRIQTQPTVQGGPLVFPTEQTLFQVSFESSGDHSAALRQFFNGASARIQRLGEAEIVFNAPAQHESTGAIEFNAPHIVVRWVVHWHVHAIETGLSINYRVAELISAESESISTTPVQASRIIARIMDEIRLPLEDAAAEASVVLKFPTIASVEPKTHGASSPVGY